jgi:hypothetical protein
MIRPACLSLLAVLSLAACQKSEERAAEASSPAPSTSPVAPAADPNILTAEGLGPARIGMSLADLTAAWGADSNPEAVGGAEPETCDQFHPTGAPEGVMVMVQNGKLTRISLIRDAKVKTDRGFGLGDQGLAIKQAYGGAIMAHPAKYEPAPAEDLISWARGGSTGYVEDPAARGVRYEVDGTGKVTAIHAGDPSIQLVEGCS